MLLVAALVALVIGEVVDQVIGSSASAQRRGVASWVAAVAPLVDETTALGPVLGEVRQGATSGGRQVLERHLALLTASSAAERDDLSSLGMAPPSAAVGSALQRCLDGRAGAAAALGRAVALATSARSPASALTRAEGALDGAARDLAASDRDYALFRKLLGHRGASLPHRSVWLADPAAWSAAALARWAGALHGDPALAGRPQLALAALTVSPRVLEIRGLPTTTTTTTTTTSTTTTTTTTTLVPGSSTTSSTTTSSTTTSLPARRVAAVTPTTLQLPPPGSLSIVQPTGRLAVAAIVSDEGAVAVGPVTLQAELLPDAGGPTQSVGRHLGMLAAGGARYVVLRGLRPRRGASYRLVVTASAPGAAPVTDHVALCDASGSGRCA